MFESVLSYQAIDSAIALLLAWVLAYVSRCCQRRLGSQFPRALGSAYRSWLWVGCPLAVVIGMIAIVVAELVLQPLATRVADAYDAGPVSVRFLGFGVAYYLWLVWVPLFGWIMAIRNRGRSARRDRWWASIWLMVSLAIVVDSIAIEPNRITVRQTEISIEDWPPDRPPLRIVVLADLQTPVLTGRERRVAKLVRDLDPDLVLLPGDLVAQSLDDSIPVEAARHVLTEIDASLGAFAVSGDCDPFVEGGVARVVEGTPVRYLDNESVVLPGAPFLEIAGFDPSRRTSYREAIEREAKAPIRIAVVHQPRFAEEIAWRGFHGVVAGHTHGGQVVIPGFGPPITESPLPRDVAAGGLHPLTNGAWLYISRGIGLEAGFAPPVRFFCPPEVSVLILGPPRESP